MMGMAKSTGNGLCLDATSGSDNPGSGCEQVVGPSILTLSLERSSSKQSLTVPTFLPYRLPHLALYRPPLTPCNQS